MKAKTEGIFILVLGASLLYSSSLASAVRTVCQNGNVALRCTGIQNPSAKHVWQYKPYHSSSWKTIAHFSREKAYLAYQAPLKFKKALNVSTQGTLVVSSFYPGLSGVYTCSNRENKILYHTVVTVVAVTCKKEVCKGDDARLQCDLLQYKNLLLRSGRIIELEWKHGQKLVISIGPNMSLSYHSPNYKNLRLSREIEGELVIESTAIKDDGQRYTCVLRGEGGITPRRHSVTLNVRRCEKQKPACEGKSIDLKCPYYQLLTTRIKDTRLEWYNGSRKIVTLSTEGHTIHPYSPLIRINESGIVTLVSPTVFDGGGYVCKVFQNEVLLAEHNVTVNITDCISTPPRYEKKQTGKGENKVLLIVLPVTLVAVAVAVGIGLWVKKRRRHLSDTPTVEQTSVVV